MILLAAPTTTLVDLSIVTLQFPDDLYGIMKNVFYSECSMLESSINVKCSNSVELLQLAAVSNPVHTHL